MSMGPMVKPILLFPVHQMAGIGPVLEAAEIPAAVDAALRLAYNSYVATAVLISQKVIGIKSFQEQAAK